MINCHPVEQSNFEPDWRSVEGMLRGKMIECQALIHIVGMRYGAEPDPASLPPGIPRRSYTQMEYDLGCELHKARGDSGFRVYTFICPETFPYDACPEPESADKAALQLAHRAQLLAGPHLYEQPAGDTDIQTRILALQEQVLLLKQQQQDVRQEVRRSRSTLWLVLALLVLSMAGVAATHYYMQRGFTRIATGPQLDAIRIKNQLREASERKLAEDLRAAEKHTGPFEERERLQQAAQESHEQRLLRIDDVAASLLMLEKQGNTTPEMREMLRVLNDEGVERALHYIEQKRSLLLQRAKEANARRTKLAREQMHVDLRPLLEQANLQATTDKNDDAQKNYQELLSLDAQWQEPLLALSQLYSQQVISAPEAALKKGMLTLLSETEAAVQHADSLLKATPNQEGAVKLLAAEANRWAAFSLECRGHAEDRSKAHGYLKLSLRYATDFLTANPSSSEGAQTFILSSVYLGYHLIKRNGSGDKPAALTLLSKALEVAKKFTFEYPDSARWLRNVAAVHNELGRLYSQDPEKGSAEKALDHRASSYELTEKAWSKTPTTQYLKNIAETAAAYARLLSDRRQPGDQPKVIALYERCVQIREQVYKERHQSPLEAVELSRALTGYAKVRKRQGQAQEVDKLYQRTLEVIQKAWLAHPELETIAHMHASTLINMATVLIERVEHYKEAEALLNEAQSVIHQMNKMNPDSTNALHLAMCLHYRFAELLEQRKAAGDVDLALEHLRKGLEARNKLTSSQVVTVEDNLSYSSALLQYGDLLLARNHEGDLSMALEAYQRATSTNKDLLNNNPHSTKLAMELCACLARLGNALTERAAPGDAEAAWQYYGQYNQLAEMIVQANPNSAYEMENLWASYAKLASHSATFHPEDELLWRRKTCGVLQAMEKQGMHLSAADKEYYDWVKERVLTLERESPTQ